MFCFDLNHVCGVPYYEGVFRADLIGIDDLLTMFDQGELVTGRVLEVD
jgi:hypothetical protein